MTLQRREPPTTKSAAAATARLIINHSVMVGLTPLIPIPLLDDLVKSFFYKSMIQSLAHARGVTLTDAEIAVLADERSRGCIYGCLFGVTEYLIKRLISKLIFVLEWRRAVDLVTHTYYFGHLLAYAFEQGWYTPAGPGDLETAARLRTAIEQARAGANLNLVKRVVETNFRQSRRTIVFAVGQITTSLRGIGRWTSGIFRRLRRRKRKPTAEATPAESAVAETLEREAPVLNSTIGGLVDILQEGIGRVPDDHFEALQNRLGAALHPTAAEAGP